MKINKVEIENFRGIAKAEIDLSDHVNIFVGINGSGKSTILDAVAISLSWLVNRIQRTNASGRPIPDSSIKNDAAFASVKLTVTEQKKKYSWILNKRAIGNPIAKSDLFDVTELASTFQNFLFSNEILPVIAYYPINRVVDRIVPEVSEKENLNILDVYENSLGGKTNYQSFFEWFRLQDDIINEKARYRSSWMKQNKPWLKKRTKKLISLLEKSLQDEGASNEWFSKMINRFAKDDFIFEEPRFLFRELIELLHASQFSSKANFKFDKILLDIEYMMHQMMSFSESRQDNLIDVDKFPMSTIGVIVDRIYGINHREDFEENRKMIAFIWDALLLSVQLALWWLSDKAKKEVEKLFSDRDPIKLGFNKVDPNTTTIELQVGLSTLMNNEVRRLENATKSGGRESRWVTEAIENFVPGYKNLRVTRIPRPHLLIDKDGITISLDQLSDGEKNLLVLVGDIARRLSIGNPNNNKPLEGNGIILIDEIDLHLHPGWQRLMIPQLTKVFPNCQFIITTHSPQVLSHTKPENIFILKNENNLFSYSKPTESYGQTTDRILEDLLGVSSRPPKEKEMIHQLFILIQDGDIDDAKELASNLNKLIGEDPELYKANVLIKRKAAIGK